MSRNGDEADLSVYDDDTIKETLEIERRLRGMGYAPLVEVLDLGGEFPYEGKTVEEIVEEAHRYLLHQETVDLAGARILAAIGEAAVKAQAFDAIAKLVGERRSR